jgi:hypothetical protein
MSTRIVAVFDGLGQQEGDIVTKILEDVLLSVHNGHVSVANDLAPDPPLVEMLWGYRSLYKRRKEFHRSDQVATVLRMLGYDVAARDKRERGTLRTGAVPAHVEALTLSISWDGDYCAWEVYLEREGLLANGKAANETAALLKAKEWHEHSQHSWRELEYRG